MRSPSSTQPLRIAVIGAGAIGGHFAARLAEAGHSVTVLDRGATLDAIQKHGLRYASGSEPQRSIAVRAAASPLEMESPELVVLALKSHVLPTVVPTLSPLLQGGATVLPIGNGLPWWYFLVPGKPLSGLRLRRVDPEGAIERTIDMQQVLGGSVMASCHCPEPGSVVHSSGGRVSIGEPAGGNSARVQHWAGVLADAGLGAVVSDDIRSELWLKLLGNACANPLSLLTGVTTDRMLDDGPMRQLFERMMNECITLGRSLGLTIQTDATQRMAQTRKLGAIKTSMLQDLEAGRSVELDAILGAALESASALQQQVPQLESAFALACMRAQQAGLYMPGVAGP
ncbi:ketopantoate reductase family protein [Variovorax sp. PAMC26660]|uniref:ketopantoate reductase family protein n=1 Tax=Variovorax sp. PAMC26660 TaxID=2762322 RepID=UPI00164DE4D1|nr:2-dehydropantoate 2-reductase [Variovorax sp. PAMC26660]QNK71342.1 2-dehydropantoate 2-reductase [Variovorax sp. PAMC26660]